ncbi:acyltransferase [Roseimarinus sediminis]|uniref:acyltransferase n=1 Tax=Roseimarinus sediminis TaxID=1610899 RepID=UPI003D198F37
MINTFFSKLFCTIYKYKFERIGNNVRISFPIQLQGLKNISIGNNVKIGYNTWMASVPKNKDGTSLLSIGNGTYIGNFNHIYCTKKIIIGNKVLIADKVYISDNLHSFEDISTPIIDQPIKQINCVSIKDGAWLGENVCVIGASVGKNCVIGANSVVTKDIPDYCVAVGAPAKVIKKYNLDKKIWEKI